MKITRTMLESVSHASKDQTRVALNGVYIEEGRAVAADGHRLVIVAPKDIEPGHRSFLIPSDVCKALLKLMPKKTKREISDPFIEFTPPEDDNTSGLIKWSYTDSKTGAESSGSYVQPDGKYPNYKQVIPQDVTPTISLNAQYLADFQKLTGDKGVVVSMKDNDHGFYIEPIGTVEQDHEFQGVAMPMRCDQIETEKPYKYWSDGIWPDWCEDHTHAEVSETA